MEKAGAYLKDLRRAQKLTQSQLAEAVEVGRGAIERLENGDDRIGVGTVLQVLKRLGASPWHYYDLAIEPARTLSEVRQQGAVIRGIAAYVRVLAERKQVPASLLDQVTRSSLAESINGATDSDAICSYALLLALSYLDAPLADLAPIIRASNEHEVIGRQQAEARGAFSIEIEQVQQHGQGEQHTIPSLDTVVSRVEADLKRYRALLILAVGYIKAEP